MQPATEIRQDLVLVGGGHAHALALRMLAMDPVAGLRITLVSPASHTPYSGMLPGLIAGHYGFEDTHIDLARLCRWAGVRFLAAEVTALDPAARRLSLAGRPAIHYDLLSIDIGSQPELDPVPGARQHAVPVKPVAGLWRRWQELERQLQTGRSCRIAVVGGGAGSVELILAMTHRLQGRDIEFALYCGADEILLGYNRRARRAVEQALADAGVSLSCGRRVERVSADQLHFAGGGDAGFEHLFWCTGAAPAPWLAASGLPVDGQGFLAVRDTLQSTADERIFAAGDCATQLNHPRPKAGVYAVRQGPVLARNLQAAARGLPLAEHRPQQRFLSLLSLGARRATADRGPFSATGEWVWRWKDRIDREFMARFEDLPAMTSRITGEALAQQPCGGCGAKVGPAVLAEVLEALRADFPASCLAAEPGEDAVVLPLQGPTLQSLDLLRGLVDDPWLMGRIAANHALSDLYACGARPLSALAAVILPFAVPRLQRRELKQVLAGALQEFAAVDCQLAGGHSMQGAELALGFAVNGVVGERGMLTKRGVRPGDRLILSKPLGTGTLLAAHMQLRADGRDVHAAIEHMLASNAPAAELALSHGASAATDITGFGLAGHLLEMLQPGQGARLNLDCVPALPGALAAMGQGIFSTAREANTPTPEQLAGAEHELARELLFDPQTSGGLLLSVAAQRAGELLVALQRAGSEQAAIIGEVVERAPGEPPLEVSA